MLTQDKCKIELLTDLDVPAMCKNCGTELSGRFCSHCGQADKAVDPTLHDLFHELTHEFLHLDGKIVATLKALILSPGKLTSEHLAGRRARYVGPVRLYLTFSLIFFVLAAYNPERREEPSQKQETQQTKVNTSEHSDARQTGKSKESEGSATQVQKEGGVQVDIAPGLRHRMTKNVSKSIHDPELFKHAFLANVSRVMFVLVPLFALGLRIAYKNRKKRYPAFAYFSLHYHAFLFFALTIRLLPSFTGVTTLQNVVSLAVITWTLVYLFLAMRRVFGGSKRKTFIRMVALGAFYLPCFAIGFVVAAAITLLTF